MDVKVNLIFEQDKAGWSETWYNTAGVTIEDVSERLVIPLATARQNLCAKTCKIVHARLSDESINGDGVFPKVLAIVGATTLSVLGDPPFSGLVCRSESTSLYRKSTTLRGLPQGLMVEDWKDTPIYPAWKKRFDVWSKILTTVDNGWSLRVREKNNPAFTWPITGVINDPAAPGLLRITAPGHNFPNGSKVRLSGLKFSHSQVVKGVFQVFNSQPGEFSIVHLPLDGFYNGFGKAKLVEYVYRPITSNRLMRTSSRKVGAVFGGFRGRRSAKAGST